MISAVIMAYGGEDYSTDLEQVKLLTEDIIILKMNDSRYTISLHGSGSMISSGGILKGYGELLTECIECASGEYVVLLKSGDNVMPDSSFDIKEGCHVYYADIFEDRYEGIVRYREPRVFKKGASLKGRFQLDEIDDMGTCGLSIQRNSSCERSFLKEWIENELQDTYGWREEYILAECCYVLGQYNDACSHYKRIYSLRQFIPSPALYRDMCWAFIAGDCFKDGREAVEEALKIYPSSLEFYYIGGIIYRELGEDRRCISCLEKLLENAGRENQKELTGYKGTCSFRLMGEALYAVEEYKRAAFYYSKCVLERPGDKQYMKGLCSSLQLSGLGQKEIEDYLRNDLSMSSDDVNECMVEHFINLRMWDKSGEYAERLQGDRSLEVKVESMYHLKSYKDCLSEISSSSLMEKEHYSIMGLCCMLLDSAIPWNDTKDFIIRLKNIGYVEVLHIYEYFIKKTKSPCSQKLLQEFSEMLLETGDSRCIKYVRQAMDENPGMDYLRLINRAFTSRLYYFCEEIVNIYYKEGRYEYQVLRILSYVYYHTGNFSECERYISYALIMKKSVDLIKLGCMCKLKECSELIKSYENSMEVKSVQRLLGTISEYENIFICN